MKKLSKLFATVLGLGLAVGVFAGLSSRKDNKAVPAKADADTVATFNKVFNDSFNNVAGSPSGYNYSLLCFNFSSSRTYFDSPSDVEYNDASIMSKIKLNGIALSTYESARLRSWHDQPWLYIYYPAVSTARSVLEFESGIVINGVEINHFALSLNNDSRWVPSIYGDDLVKNSDYKLFTISDYPFNSNMPGGYIIYSANGFVDAMNDSFGFRFNVSLSELTSSGVFKFGCTNMYGSSPKFAITLDYDNNVFLTFNGAIDWNTSIAHSWALNEEHLVEIYFVKVSSTSAHVLLGINGELIFKSGAKDITDMTFGNFISSSCPTTSTEVYTSATDTTSMALARFAKRQLHTDTIPFSDRTEGNACRGENGYYEKASSFYANYLTKNQKVEFATSDTYEQERERMTAWAAANGTTISFNPTSGEIVPANALPLFNIDLTNNKFEIAIVISIILSIGIAVFFILFKPKKKHQ